RIKCDYAAPTPGHYPLARDGSGNVIEDPSNAIWGDSVTWTFNGVITPGMVDDSTYAPRGKVTMASVEDGTSNTMLVGEKFIPTNQYTNWWWGDDKGPFHGWDN